MSVEGIRDLNEAELRDAYQSLQRDIRDHEGRIRDQFAMAALAGIVANTNIGFESFDQDAHDAYGWADACLVERRKRQKEGQ